MEDSQSSFRYKLAIFPIFPYKVLFKSFCLLVVFLKNVYLLFKFSYNFNWPNIVPFMEKRNVCNIRHMQIYTR